MRVWTDLSVVICAHNAEKTIERTLRSLEPLIACGARVILVDDDSSDRTKEIAQGFGEVHKTLEFLRIPRSGSAGARNIGLSLITSKYVMFCDSDDEVIASSFDAFNFPESNFDFLIFDYELMKNHQVTLQRAFTATREFSDEDEITVEVRHLLLEQMGFWRYIYRTSFLRENKIRFIGELDEIKADFFVLDDYFFLLGVLSSATTFGYIPRGIYRYHSNTSASFERFRRQSRFMGRAAYIQMGELLNVLNEESKTWFGARLSEQIMSSFKVLKESDSFIKSPSFARAIWTVNQKFKKSSLKNLSLQFIEMAYVLARKILLRILKR
jgi:glycosyltransferase involved in cell wall biosynthesis